MKKSNIAILGATSHIAKGLINNFLHGQGVILHLYTFSPDKLRSFLGIIGKTPANRCIIHEGYRNFVKHPYDTIINCVGVGTQNKLRGDYYKYFTVTEEYDNLVIGYLCKFRPDSLYISLSSGSVYGRGFLAPVEENSTNNIRVNHIAPEDCYTIARINSEAKHRSFKNLRIIDLRIFAYFSRFIDLQDDYFMTEVIKSILNNKTLLTDSVNMARDYVHPKDLFSLIKKCINSQKINIALDVFSSRPVEKKEILDYFSSQYGLRFKMRPFLRRVSATGVKNIYCSNYRNSATIGYKPVFSSMDAIKEEARYIIRP